MIIIGQGLIKKFQSQCRLLIGNKEKLENELG